MVRAADLVATEPQTPDELAALKAENARKRRSRNTTMNLVLSLAASLGVMLVLVLIVVRPEGSQLTPVDHVSVAADIQASRDWPVAAPALPANWSANAAELRTDSADRAQFWYLGIITDQQTFLSVSQRPGADETWAVRTLGGILPTGTVEIDGQLWQVYDRRDDPEAGNTRYALSTDLAGSTVIIAGTGTEEQAAELARATGASLRENPLAVDPAVSPANPADPLDTEEITP